MKLGIGTYTFSWAIGVPGFPVEEPLKAWGVAELLKFASQRKLGVVQLADNLAWDQAGVASFDKWKAQALELNIEFETGTRGIQSEHLLHHLSLSQNLNAKLVRSMVDGNGWKPTHEEAVRELRKAMPRYEDKNVLLALENHDRLLTSELVAIIQDVQSPNLGICLDTVNSFGALEAPETVIKAFAPYCLCLHVKDFNISRVNGQMGFSVEGAPAGKGRLDCVDLFRKVKALAPKPFGPEPNAILELWVPAENTVEKSITKEFQWAQESMEFLTTLQKKEGI